LDSSILSQVDRNTALFHLEFKHPRRELANLIGLPKAIVHQKSQVFHVSPALSSSSLIGLIQVHPDENAPPVMVPWNRRAIVLGKRGAGGILSNVVD
jgi:hypothetical protein